MNILDFNNKEFKKAILNNIENKENLDNELLDDIIKYEANELAERVASSYDTEIELQNNMVYLKKYYTEHMVDKKDYDYLDIDGEDNTLIRINNVRFDTFKGTKYFDFLVCITNTDVYDWQNIFIKRSNDEDFEVAEMDGRMWEVLEWHMFNKNNN